MFVPDAHIADYLLCVARTKPKSGITIFLADAKNPRIKYTGLKTIAVTSYVRWFLTKCQY